MGICLGRRPEADFECPTEGYKNWEKLSPIHIGCPALVITEHPVNLTSHDSDKGNSGDFV